MTIVHGDGMHSTTNLALTGFSLPPLHVVTLIVISSSFIGTLLCIEGLKICPKRLTDRREIEFVIRFLLIQNPAPPPCRLSLFLVTFGLLKGK